jgi:Mg-chelatase subunit ChlI
MSALVRVLPLALVLSCAAAPSPTIIAGQTVDTLEQTYTAVGNEMNRGLRAGYVSPSAYEKWAAAAPKLKASIHLARDLWLSAKDVEDAAAAERIQVLLAGVRAQLDAFMADISQAVTAFSAQRGAP